MFRITRLAGWAAITATVTLGACATSPLQPLGREERSPGGGTTVHISQEDQRQMSLLEAQAAGAVSTRDWPQAETLLRRMLAIDWNDTRSIHTRHSLAEVLEAQERYAEAVADYRIVLRESEEAWGGEDGSPRIAERLNLGRALVRVGERREAERYYLEALGYSVEALRTYTPQHHSEVIDGPQVSTFAILLHLEQLLNETGRGQEMERRYREVLPLYVAAVGEEDRYTQAIRDKLAALTRS